MILSTKIKRGFLLLATSFGFAIVQLDVSVVNVAIKTIGESLGNNIALLQWIVNAYTMAFAAFILSAGALGDRIGAKKLFVIGFALFTVASAACGVAPSAIWLIAARVVQGIGAAMLVPCSLALINHTYTQANEHARAVGLWAAGASIALAAGPLVGGLLIHAIGWQAIFFINVPFGVLSIVLTLWCATETPRTTGRAIDWPGQMVEPMMFNNLEDQLKAGSRIDITPRLISDGIELAEVYIAYMRAHEDFETVPDMMNRFYNQIFVGNGTSLDQLRQLAVYAIDKIYRIAAELEKYDDYTAVYFKKVIAQLMQSLQDEGIEVFYILDNEIRGDRFKLTVRLYELSGATVVVPYISDKTLSFDEVEERFKSPMAHGRNIVYIEKDASVNYIEKVMKIATESRYIGLFRNYEPSVNTIKVL